MWFEGLYVFIKSNGLLVMIWTNFQYVNQVTQSAEPFFVMNNLGLFVCFGFYVNFNHVYKWNTPFGLGEHLYPASANFFYAELPNRLTAQKRHSTDLDLEQEVWIWMWHILWQRKYNFQIILHNVKDWAQASTDGWYRIKRSKTNIWALPLKISDMKFSVATIFLLWTSQNK